MECTEEILDGIREEGWIVCDAPVPEYDSRDAVECAASCRKNLCGSYGTTWACPPGWSTSMEELGRRFDKALVIEKTFVGGPDDAPRMSAELHRTMRRIVMSLRSEGRDCMGFADGACDYCGVCAYPEPCRFPEQLLPSVSALGVDMGKYLSSVGKTFSFVDGKVTLYGIVMYR